MLLLLLHACVLLRRNNSRQQNPVALKTMTIIIFIFITVDITKTARLPEWSKGVDLRSTVHEYSWVQIPHRAFFSLTHKHHSK